MTPFYADDSVTLYHGDCLDVLRDLPDNCVDAVVTDPPYGLGFMGREWDDLPPGIEFATECLRVLKPGGHMLAFGGSRTWHRLACAVEDAGFEIRDSIAWLYGSGFPKSLDVSKAIDKGTGENRQRQLEFTAWMRSTGITARQIDKATDSFMGSHYLTDKAQAAIATAEMFDRLRPFLPEVPERIERLVAERTGIEWIAYTKRKVIAVERRANEPSGIVGVGQGERVMFDRKITASATADAERWQGWGTALKPAFEPIVVGRKPLTGTVAANVLAHGTGALNIDGCRVGTDLITAHGGGVNGEGRTYGMGAEIPAIEPGSNPHNGRWPSNVALDESQAAELDRQSGDRSVNAPARWVGGTGTHDGWGNIGKAEPGDERGGYGDSGGASRFFPTFRYEPKAPTTERPRHDGTAHPTVKPLDLMRWLVRLVTPPDGTVLEPFAGSGTTAEACVVEGFKCVAVEREADYLPLIVQRLTKPIQVTLSFD